VKDIIGVVKVTRRYWDGKPPRVSFEVIRAESEEELYIEYFKQFDNRNKYINDVITELADEGLSTGYREWIININNYAKAGGDMW
jgi:hypothetical protein